MNLIKFTRFNILALILIVFPSIFTEVKTEKILFFLPIATKSHKNVFDPLINTLAARGHQVTVVSPIPPSKTKNENITELVPLPYTDIFEDFHDPFEQRKEGGFSRINSVDFIFDVSDKIYQTKEIKSLLKAPVITVTAMAAPSFTTMFVGNHLPTSFVPLPFLSFTDNMSFMERLVNTGTTLVVSVLGVILYGPKMTESNQKNNGFNCPPIETLDTGVSMIFSNSFFALTFPRPVQPDVVEVGGMHCGPAKPLPKDLDEFLTGAEHGFIYFSMGSVVQTDKIPDDMKQKFLNVFLRMKQRVIWKWNSGHMEGLPPNVRVSKWLPQQDILGHPNIRVFITHGGLLSTQEAAYHGVPLVGIPIFADQDLNMKQAENNGYALTLEVLDFTEEILEDLLNKIIYDPQYVTKAKHLSAVFRDQMQSPLERAVYWAEYVIKHKGAAHLRSASRNLNFFQYHSLDVIAFLTTILVMIVSILIFSCRLCFKIICRRSDLRTTAEQITKKRK